MVRHPLFGSTGRRACAAFGVALGLVFGLLPACSSDNDGGPAPTNTGQTCATADQCYPGVKAGELLGEAVCLDKVTDGYCTHLCAQDSDCCAAVGECAGAYAEVCAPFESTDDMYCFLSCEDEDIAKTTLKDADQYCHAYAGAAFGCRSTGGGSKNRKVCMP
jgi:hypothetical protein